MAYVVYHKDTTIICKRKNGDRSFASEAAAKAFITRQLNGDANYAVAELGYFEDNIEKRVERVNIMSGVKYMEPVNTPPFMSPACESYWTF